MTGGKLRKYASILPWLKKEAFQQVGLIGSANSNHIVSAAQLLIASGIQVVPIVKQSWAKGSNQTLLELLIDRSDWIEIDNQTWFEAENIAEKWAKDQSNAGIKTAFLPEGAFVSEALLGAMTLSKEIIEQSQYLKTDFQHIFIDAGTCLSAIGLAFGLAELSFSGQLHVVSMAEDENGYWQRWENASNWLPADQKEDIEAFKSNIALYRPVSAPRFGTKNQTVMDAIQRYARDFGLLTDPIYSAKHLMTCEMVISSLPEDEPVLIIHGGGAQSLLGFLSSE